MNHVCTVTLVRLWASMHLQIVLYARKIINMLIREIQVYSKFIIRAGCRGKYYPK